MVESSLHSLKIMYGRKIFNRVFAAIYAFAIIALFYHHSLRITTVSPSFISLTIFIFMLISDLILAFMWFTSQSFFMHPITRQEFPEKLEKLIDKKDYPALDIFICTADPFKEPPLTTVNTALSVLAYDYPTEKLSVYVSDDGGSKLILFALMEAAKFARNWLPYCREHKIMERCPEEYFRRNHSKTSRSHTIKNLYEDMKIRIENAVERGEVLDEYITDAQQREAFSKWTNGFTPKNHPAIIQVLLESEKDKGNSIPNLVYASREKNTSFSHHFKAGALNALLRVSEVMTNAPIVLTLDCDMYSNDPQTPQRVLCYFCDPSIRSKLGYVQFPQRYHGLNEDDTYGGDNVRTFRISPSGLDGLGGPDNCGTGCFFNRQSLFGDPSSASSSLGVPEACQFLDGNMPISSASIIGMAHHVASCNYECNTGWGTKMGIKYGTLVEDIYTGYRLQCDGWHSILCNPERPAFLGEVPINLNDVLSQVKRWSFGHLEVLSCKYSPLTFGTNALGLLRANCYTHYVFWPFWCIPVTLYACLPQLTLLNSISIFPKVFDPWFYLYVFLFVGAYGHDFVQFILFKGTVNRYWNDQRMWFVKALSPFLFASIEFLVTKKIGITTKGFNVTSKVVEQDERKLYDQGVFTFGVPSPMFVPLVTASIINLIAFLRGVMTIIFKMESLDEFFIQLFIAGFAVANCLPIYEAMLLRSDQGRMPNRTLITSTMLAGALCIAFSLVVN